MNLSPVSYQPFLNLWDSTPWVEIRDGNHYALDIFSRHYSRYVYKDGRNVNRFVGPGERMVLMSHCGRALFVWRKFISKDDQVGINCSIFRNESEYLSSWLIEQAVVHAERKWPGERKYTYVNPAKIKSANPGYCFKIAGWKMVGVTKARRLHILALESAVTDL